MDWPSQVLADWFWGETVAGKVLLAVKEAGRTNEDNLMRTVISKLIIPACKVARGKME